MTRTAGRRARVIVAITAVLGSLFLQAPAGSNTLLPQALRGLTVPAGFGVGTFAVTPNLLPTSLAFGPDGKLYVAAVKTAATAPLADGVILAYEDLGGVGGPPETVLEGLHQVLGVAFGPDKTMYISDNVGDPEYKGRILAVPQEQDGHYENPVTVLSNIPNGRHQTNGMVFGPDGMMYLANGSATDDGIECGPEPASSNTCPTPEVKPWTGAILRLNPAWRNVNLLTDIRVDADSAYAADGMDDESVLVSPGYRNIYDVDFWPGDPSMIYTPMNGSDNPASNEPLFRTSVTDQKVVGQDASGNPIWGPIIDDAGFPSCLYGAHVNNFPVPEAGAPHPHPETFEPVDNPNTAVTDRFGPCQKNKVIRPIMFFRSAHNGTSGAAFERGENFPDRYDSDLFVAEWGSIWNLNGALPTGHKITHVDIGPDGLPQRKREFMTGAVPMDVTFGPDGAMYVADFQGMIFRVASVMDTPDTATIEIQAGQFVPAIVAVPRGTTVLWVNLDTRAHNVVQTARVLAEDKDQYQTYCVDTQDVTPCSSNIDSSGDIPPRGSYKYEFGDLDGLWVYQSTAGSDAGMQGTVIVAPVDR